jgi:3-carboxy-cis,cis-muconate cycloisomerase
VLTGSYLRSLPYGTPAMLAVWNDGAWLRAALDFESALARAQAACGLMSQAQADKIAAAAEALTIDPAALAAEAAHAGTLAIPLVAALRTAVAAFDPAAGARVHLGATSQDVADTAMVLQARTAVALLLADLARAVAALAQLAAAHAQTPLAGRTLLQPARPVSFGLKCAQWMVALDDAAARLRRESAGALTLALGGAAGTLDGMAGQGQAVTEAVAARLELPVAATPWHARRGNLAGLGAACAIAAGEAAKMARDIVLLAQAEIGEAREPAARGRGGSSAMAHKRNQTLCQQALIASLRAPGLAATLLSGLVGEHERGMCWQADAPVLAELFCAAHAAAAAMAETAEGLDVDVAAMAGNLAACGIGTGIGEAERLTHAALALHGRTPECHS